MVTVTITMNVAEAKAKLSQLLDAAAAGDEVVIARSGKPVVRLVPVDPLPRRQLGFLPGPVPSDDFFDPLTGEDLEAWYR